jgi:hypothetical protein
MINALNDLSDKTMNFKYRDFAKKLCIETIDKFYLKDKDIFQKNQKNNNDIFLKPIDISDNTIPNGNAIMLINLIRLGFDEETKKLANSLNGYLNIYKNHMMTAIRAIDFFNNINAEKNCNEKGCKINELKKLIGLVWLLLVILWNYRFSKRNAFSRCVGCRIFVDIVYNYSVSSIKILAKKYRKK